MGSFNETCALSRFQIGYGDEVRYLFLTANPYKNDEGAGMGVKRGCYITDQWFARTPTIKGTYDSYGSIEFEENITTDLIAKMFDAEVVERPFGFNQYHEHNVTAGLGIKHYIEAAYQGRLLIDPNRNCRFGDVENKPSKEIYPSWRDVKKTLEDNKLKVMDKRDDKAYKVVPIIPGVVCVGYNDYGNNTKPMLKARKILEKHYDCQATSSPNELGSIYVTRKGATENPAVLYDVDLFNNTINSMMSRHKETHLPVCGVMIREDVWQMFINQKRTTWDNKKIGIKYFQDEINKGYKRLKDILKKEESELKDRLARFAIGELIMDLGRSTPGMTVPSSHLGYALRNLDKYSERQINDLIQNIAEINMIDYHRETLKYDYYLPSLGHQEMGWRDHIKALEGLLAIAKSNSRRRV